MSLSSSPWPVRRRTAEARTLVVGVVSAVLALSGCSTVTLSEPSPTGATAARCAEVIGSLPAEIVGQSRRDVTPGVYAAAWGDPTITLRCGVDRPVAFNDSSACFEVAGLDWFPEPAEGGSIFTMIGRAALVEVRVPERYAPPGDALIDLAPTLVQRLADRGGC